MEDTKVQAGRPGPKKKNVQGAVAAEVTQAPERQKSGRKPNPNKVELIAITVSLPKSIVEQLKTHSVEQYRTPSNQVAFYVTEGMRKDGLFKEESSSDEN